MEGSFQNRPSTCFTEGSSKIATVCWDLLGTSAAFEGKGFREAPAGRDQCLLSPKPVRVKEKVSIHHSAARIGDARFRRGPLGRQSLLGNWGRAMTWWAVCSLTLRTMDTTQSNSVFLLAGTPLQRRSCRRPYFS